MLPSRRHRPKSWWSIGSFGAMAPAPLIVPQFWTLSDRYYHESDRHCGLWSDHKLNTHAWRRDSARCVASLRQPSFLLRQSMPCHVEYKSVENCHTWRTYTLAVPINQRLHCVTVGWMDWMDRVLFVYSRLQASIARDVISHVYVRPV